VLAFYLCLLIYVTKGEKASIRQPSISPSISPFYLTFLSHLSISPFYLTFLSHLSIACFFTFYLTFYLTFGEIERVLAFYLTFGEIEAKSAKKVR
jgi:hypothetical protein